MSFPVQSMWLLAAWRTNWRDTFNGDYFQSNTREVWVIFVTMAVLVAGALLWQLASSRAYGRLPSNSMRGMFRELSRAHGLNRSSRRILRRLAAAHGVTPPVLLFVQPEQFAMTELPDDLLAKADEIAQLEQILFAESPSGGFSPTNRGSV